MKETFPPFGGGKQLDHTQYGRINQTEMDDIISTNRFGFSRDTQDFHANFFNQELTGKTQKVAGGTADYSSVGKISSGQRIEFLKSVFDFRPIGYSRFQYHKPLFEGGLEVSGSLVSTLSSSFDAMNVSSSVATHVSASHLEHRDSRSYLHYGRGGAAANVLNRDGSTELQASTSGTNNTTLFQMGAVHNGNGFVLPRGGYVSGISAAFKASTNQIPDAGPPSATSITFRVYANGSFLCDSTAITYNGTDTTDGAFKSGTTQFARDLHQFQRNHKLSVEARLAETNGNGPVGIDEIAVLLEVTT